MAEVRGRIDVVPITKKVLLFPRINKSISPEKTRGRKPVMLNRTSRSSSTSVKSRINRVYKYKVSCIYI